MAFNDENNPLAVNDTNVKRWVGGIFIFLAFIFIYALGWHSNYPIIKKIFIDKKYEYSYETMEGHKKTERTVGAESEIVKNIGYHHLRIGIVMILTGLYFITALFWMFKSRQRLLTACLIPLAGFLMIYLYFGFR